MSKLLAEVGKLSLFIHHSDHLNKPASSGFMRVKGISTLLYVEAEMQAISKHVLIL